MTDNMKKFAEFVSANEEAKKELHEAVAGIREGHKQALFDATVKFADKYGLKLTEDDFKAEKEEISEDELKAVVAGEDPLLALCFTVFGCACW